MQPFIFLVTWALFLRSSNAGHSTEKKPPEEKNSTDLIFHLNAAKGYYFPSSSCASKVALLDYRNNLSTYCDGEKGDCFVISYENYKGYYLSGRATNLTWHSNKQSLESYYKNPVPPVKLWEESVERGTEFHPDDMPKEYAEALSKILSPLSPDYGDQCEAPSIANYISKITSDSLKQSLTNFERVMGQVKTKFRGDFKFLIGIFQGMRYFFDCFPHGTKSLTEKNVTLQLDKILNEKTPFHVLIYFIESLKQHFDVGKILQKRVNCPVEFFTLLQRLGGEIDYGFDGCISVVTEIVKYLHGKSSKKNLVATLTRFFKDKRGTDENLEQIWRTSVNDLYTTVNRRNLKEDFKDLARMLRHILRGRWCEKGVDMSGVMERILRERRPGNDQSVKRVLRALQKKCKEEANDD